MENADPIGIGDQALAGFLPASEGEGQEAGAEPEKLQGQWDDAGGVFQKRNGRAVMWERADLLMQSRESTQQSASGD